MEPPPPPAPPTPLHQLHFTPIHRTVQLENIYEQVTQNDLHQEQIPSTRKVLTKYLTVIGDGSDIDTCELKTQ
jgi:hypothetical protein